MKLHLVPPRQGFSWALEGWQTFRQQPFALMAVLMLCIMTASLLGALPLIGLVLTQALTPAIGLVMMVATAQVRQGKKLSPSLLGQALWRGPDRLKILAVIGFAYFAVSAVVLAASTLIDDGTMARVYLGLEELDPERIRENPRVGHAALFAAAAHTLVSMPFWHASALAHWHGLPATKAMFFSAVACARNLGAFMVYGLSWLAAGLAVSALAVVGGVILGTVAGPALVAVPMALFIIVSALILAVIFLGSAVFTFRDCFDAPNHSDHL